MELDGLYKTIDMIIFILSAFPVLYMSLYAAASIRKCHVNYPDSRNLYRILVLFPAYKEDSVIENSVRDFLGQDYPPAYFDVFVISDGMRKETNEALAKLPVKVLEADYQNSTKAKALKFAIKKIGDKKYDIVVIMDADNTAEKDFLTHIANAYDSGFKAIQAHRVAKNLNTDTAILDAISEEINNSIFRKGHINLGVSSALIGSGMAFDFQWFKENVNKIRNLPEERELEVLLMRQRIHVDYLENVRVFDEKTQKDAVFFRQRRRWLASQLETLCSVIKELPYALFSINVSYADKIIQWFFLPRIVILGMLFLVSLIETILSPALSVKWWALLVVLLSALLLSVPRYLMNERSLLALKRVPLLFILMLFNLFRLKNANKRWTHTEKNFK